MGTGTNLARATGQPAEPFLLVGSPAVSHRAAWGRTRGYFFKEKQSAFVLGTDLLPVKYGGTALPDFSFNVQICCQDTDTHTQVLVSCTFPPTLISTWLQQCSCLLREPQICSWKCSWGRGKRSGAGKAEKFVSPPHQTRHVWLLNKCESSFGKFRQFSSLSGVP